MCGIAGIYSAARPDRALLTRMDDVFAHCGPNGSAIWSHDAPGISFGHRRLAIVDLSRAGSQPMHSADGRLVISYNGEVYNHTALRSELDGGHAPESGWRGNSDSETLLCPPADANIYANNLR